MANTFTLTSHSYDGRYMYLECSQSEDIATNESTITWKISSIGGKVNYYKASVALSINGDEVYNSGVVQWTEKTFPAAKGSTSGTITVEHDTKGDKTINVVLTTMIYDGVSKEKSDSWELDNIPRAATITECPETFKSNETLTVKYSNPAGNNVTTLRMCIADETGYYAWVSWRDLNKTGNSITFTADDIKILKEKLIPYAAKDTLKVKFLILTEIGGTKYISSQPSTFEMAEDETTKPSVTMFVDPDNGSLPGKFDGIWIQGKSKAIVSGESTFKYGASFQGDTTEIGGTVYNESSAISQSGNVEVKYIVTDSRGFKGTATETINVVEYSKPLVIPIDSENAILCYRSDGNGKRIGNSTSVWLKAKRSYRSVNNLNRCSLRWRYKLSTEAWDASRHIFRDLITKDTTNTDEYSGLLLGGEFDTRKSYTVQVLVIDDIGESTDKSFEIPTQDVALHLGRGGKNVSIGTYCDYSKEHTFYSDWDAYFDKDVYIKEVQLDYPIEQGTSGIWTYRKWASGVAECWGLYPITKAEITTPWGSLFETPIDYSVDFPSGLFVAAPAVQFSAPTAAGGVLGLETMGETTKTKTCKLYPIRATLPESTIDLTVAIQAKGLWK